MFGMAKQRFSIAVVAFVGMITTFLPWFKISGLASLAKDSIKGTAGDGWITLIVFLVAGAVAVTVGERDKPLQSPFKYVAVAAGATNLVVGLFELSNGGDDAGIYGSANPTWGLWGLMIVSIVMIAVPFFVKEEAKTIQLGGLVQQSPGAQFGEAPSKNEKTAVESIKELKELLDMEVLTQEEFDKKKDEILG